MFSPALAEQRRGGGGDLALRGVVPASLAARAGLHAVFQQLVQGGERFRTLEGGEFLVAGFHQLEEGLIFVGDLKIRVHGDDALADGADDEFQLVALFAQAFDDVGKARREGIERVAQFAQFVAGVERDARPVFSLRDAPRHLRQPPDGVGQYLRHLHGHDHSQQHRHRRGHDQQHLQHSGQFVQLRHRLGEDDATHHLARRVAHGRTGEEDDPGGKVEAADVGHALALKHAGDELTVNGADDLHARERRAAGRGVVGVADVGGQIVAIHIQHHGAGQALVLLDGPFIGDDQLRALGDVAGGDVLRLLHQFLHGLILHIAEGERVGHHAGEDNGKQRQQRVAGQRLCPDRPRAVAKPLLHAKTFP